MKKTSRLGLLAFASESREGALESLFARAATVALLHRGVRVLHAPTLGNRVLIVPDDVTLTLNDIVELSEEHVDLLTQRDYVDSLPYTYD
ncbi:hypothetical protein A3C20_03600 [Candidatus Kaiserbacteria bacterium RIFCSPHIGHO2_02_FULL_55_25]|uniref:Uncharacterized protein n=1 Tax=Candidatus Kaiserbacteria bacterium RIFCSPHIGHO2_02_FULL_55_25 TaxID=1798498 RepID=A0A1F6E733_9BACT|nr:MAG: hypothetical protein A2764_02305 [Candidatus Kaiserbacteria bacterium RIFCSPHIGHO2_01_FULL_55_79]OGG69397.1 MAG: hypothetical protein A3C20_03600 [Candidatus Kaiserbacteria bacterium RIFCSPHIGHO2_02_FULL_55_25]OGG78707.1 MAG: hypothetical protein A3F56_00655 [Candidatus Kaiserbacteria bacterium RIFCSPHIGHO2_12_FULL_55_13]OGG82670.1 MAG: hypothetical protein A3A42_02260 [Candidatus Kaiserbacteria bacterium RIFCSPLOWO2_01_FULL_55_25]